MENTILIAEDDDDIVNLLRLYLESHQFNVLTVPNGKSALSILKKESVDLAIIDIMMPLMNGYELTKALRSDTENPNHNIPIIILSARNQDTDKVLGLNIGADDYITKPFNPLEVVARVQAHLRRCTKYSSEDSSNGNDYPCIIIGELTLNTEQLTLQKNGHDIIITPNEYKILSLLMKSPKRVFTKSQICEAINGEYYDNYENAINVHISHLREKIEDDPRNPKYIINIRGLGYKIEKQN